MTKNIYTVFRGRNHAYISTPEQNFFDVLSLVHELAKTTPKHKEYTVCLGKPRDRKVGGRNQEALQTAHVVAKVCWSKTERRWVVLIQNYDFV